MTQNVLKAILSSSLSTVLKKTDFTNPPRRLLMEASQNNPYMAVIKAEHYKKGGLKTNTYVPVPGTRHWRILEVGRDLCASTYI